MRPIFRASAISTVVVVVYSALVSLLWIPLVGLFGDYGVGVVRPLSRPLELPWYVYLKFLPKVATSLGRPSIAYTFVLLVSAFGANIFLDYIPIRLFLQWRERPVCAGGRCEQKTKLP